MTSASVALPLVLGLGRMDAILAEILGGRARVVAVDDAADAVAGDLASCQAIVARGAAAVSGALIDRAPHLRVIARTGVGVESVDVAAATARGIPVMTTPGANARAVAEGAFALALALTKQLPLATEIVREGPFDRREALEIWDLEGETLGVIGLGHVGRNVARIGQAFGMTILAADPYVDAVTVRGEGIELAAIDDVVARATVLVACAPHTPQTAGLLDRDRLARLPRGAIFINVGRGSIVDLDDLDDAVASGHLAGVGLDVFEPEPPGVHPLFTRPNVILSPHVFGLSRRARQQMYRLIGEGVLAVFDGQRPPGVVNPEIYGG